MTTADRCSGALRREPGICFPILTGFAAFLQQTRAGIRDAPTPIDRQQAEGEIGAADIRPVVMVRLRRVPQTTLITGPLFRFSALRSTAERLCRTEIRGGDQTRRLECCLGDHACG